VPYRAALGNVGEIYRDAVEIDSEIVEGTRQGIRRLAKVHFSQHDCAGGHVLLHRTRLGGLSRAEALIGSGTKIA